MSTVILLDSYVHDSSIHKQSKLLGMSPQNLFCLLNTFIHHSSCFRQPLHRFAFFSQPFWEPGLLAITWWFDWLGHVLQLTQGVVIFNGSEADEEAWAWDAEIRHELKSGGVGVYEQRCGGLAAAKSAWLQIQSKNTCCYTVHQLSSFTVKLCLTLPSYRM